MSINPVDTRHTFDAPQQSAGQIGAAGVEFEEALVQAAGRAGDGQLSPALAAEMLRVKMLSSALVIGSDGQDQSFAPLGTTQRALKRFLSHLAQPHAGGADAASLDAAAEPGDAGAALQGGTAAVEAGAGEVGATGASGAADVIDKASRRFGVDRELIRAVIKAESGFNPRAVSSAGAQGLMQLMPATAKMLGVRDPFDPEQNVMAGTRFLKDLLQRYGGDVDSALAAYNWGPGNLEKSSGALPRETRDYLRKVKGVLQGIARRRARYSLT